MQQPKRKVETKRWKIEYDTNQSNSYCIVFKGTTTYRRWELRYCKETNQAITRRVEQKEMISYHRKNDQKLQGTNSSKRRVA